MSRGEDVRFEGCLWIDYLGLIIVFGMLIEVVWLIDFIRFEIGESNRGRVVLWKGYRLLFIFSGLKGKSY